MALLFFKPLVTYQDLKIVMASLAVSNDLFCNKNVRACSDYTFAMTGRRPRCSWYSLNNFLPSLDYNIAWQETRI